MNRKISCLLSITFLSTLLFLSLLIVVSAQAQPRLTIQAGKGLLCYTWKFDNNGNYVQKRAFCWSTEFKGNAKATDVPAPTDEPEYPTLTPTIFAPTRTPTPGAYPPPVTEEPYP